MSSESLIANQHPGFDVRDHSQIIAPGNRDYAIEIIKLAGCGDTASSVVPTDVDGHAFVDLAVNDCFAIVLYNYNTQFDVVGNITIDGLVVVNEFSTDAAEYPGYFVPRASGNVPCKHVIEGWLRTTKSSEKNVFQFVINALSTR